jgi:hypothetical protein
MPTATLAPTLDKLDALRVLSRPTQVGWELHEEALRAAARRAGIDAYAHRLRHYGEARMESEDGWRAKDAVRALEALERRIGRRLADHDRRTFLADAIDVMHDLV